jgi:hypothetical protein
MDESEEEAEEGEEGANVESSLSSSFVDPPMDANN